MTNLSNPQRLVLDAVEMVQASTVFEEDSNGRRWASVKEIAESTELKAPTANANAKKLVELGHLQTRKAGRLNEYALATPGQILDESDPVVQDADPFEAADAASGEPVLVIAATPHETAPDLAIPEEPEPKKARKKAAIVPLTATIKLPEGFDEKRFWDLQLTKREGNTMGGPTKKRNALLDAIREKGSVKVSDGRQRRQLEILEHYELIAVMDKDPQAWRAKLLPGGELCLLIGPMSPAQMRARAEQGGEA